MGLKVAALAAAALLTACAHQGETLVVVVPAADGHVGGVVVNPGPNQTVLDSAYAGARTWTGGPVQPQTVAMSKVDSVFADARAARPMLPVSYTLYFLQGSDEFTSESRKVVDEIFAEIARRPAAEITVIGHSDTVGLRNDNDSLSRQRADRVRGGLVKLGIDTKVIRAAGRGEREPVVKTADEVDEPKNRRVEISVR